MATLNVWVSSYAGAVVLTDNGSDFLQYYNVGPNDLDFSSGEFIRYGGNTVTPNGVPNPTQVIPGAVSGDTVGAATTINSTTGATISRSIVAESSPATPNFFSGELAVCMTNCSSTGNNNPANLQNPWTITFSNPSTSPTSVAQSISLAPGSGELPFVNSVTLSGTAAQPTFSWTPPPGAPVDGYRINIYQNNLETFGSSGAAIDSGQVTSANVGPGTTSYTIKSSDFTVQGFGIQTNTQYTIEISILQTRDNSMTNFSNANVSAISRVYSNFTIPSSGTLQTINLPTTTVSGNQVTYGFNLTVAPGVTYFLDPTITTGYSFQTGPGDPNFATVLLPNLQGSEPYTITWDNGVDSEQILGGDVFNFLTTDPLGVGAFTVTGIDPSLGLDPNDTTAFITGLTFVGGGDFTGTMTPISVEETNVPEPGSAALINVGLAGLWALRRRREIHIRSKPL
jgi:hypothetical protein